jgi:hypothetical protein
LVPEKGIPGSSLAEDTMRKFLILIAVLLPVARAATCTSSLSSGTYGTAQGASGNAVEYVVSMPEPASCYNGTMILFAHGFVPPGSSPEAWKSQFALADGTSLPALVNSLGFGFAASGYSKEGLAILQGVQDTAALTTVIQGLSISVNKYFVTGASEGGLVATKLLEGSALYKGGLAVCGPLGDFQKQIDYFGDVRVLFDYFFPGVLTSAGGNAVTIPPGLIANWATVYEPAVVKALNANPLATLQLLNTAGIPTGINFANAANAITGALSYNVLATTDAAATLGGNPYDNIGRVYSGSFNDTRLNAMVARFAAVSPAPANILLYDTSGLLGDPLVTLHTLSDPIVPYWQETLYASKVQAENRSSELSQIPVVSYGHCNVSSTDAEAALALLLLKADL